MEFLAAAGFLVVMEFDLTEGLFCPRSCNSVTVVTIVDDSSCFQNCDYLLDRFCCFVGGTGENLVI